MEHRRYDLELFADYFQFYVCDGAFVTDTGTLWDDATTDRMLAVGPDLIAVGTARNMSVPVTIELTPDAPIDDSAEWEQVIECGMAVASGVVLAFGCTEERGAAARFEVAPGPYVARVSYAGLTELSDDGLEGEDRYRVQLWPGEITPVRVIKRRLVE